jgi:hypothetical protein
LIGNKVSSLNSRATIDLNLAEKKRTINGEEIRRASLQPCPVIGSPKHAKTCCFCSSLVATCLTDTPLRGAIEKLETSTQISGLWSVSSCALNEIRVEFSERLYAEFGECLLAEF